MIFMSSVTDSSKNTVRSKRSIKVKPMTRLEMVQKMLADQKIIGEALQKGISLKQLEKSHGYKFARL
jgi:hypothetical protein